MRRTNASSVIKGIIFLLIIAWLSNLVKMSVVTYVLNQIMQMGVIVIIILFQPEIRKLFEQVGNSRINLIFRKRLRIENAEIVLQNVISAAKSMADSMTGAIIVFEREVGLNDYVMTGTRIDASVSSELIQSIFYHNSPLHDGALLIRDGRVLAASCMLPLSNNINLGRDLGMRHKAAVGISERSDAVAIVVSEQSGTISVAVDGMLKRHLDEDTFEKLLINEFVPRKKKRVQKVRG
jgi:diadenylate cyclase